MEVRGLGEGIKDLGMEFSLFFIKAADQDWCVLCRVTWGQ